MTPLVVGKVYRYSPEGLRVAARFTDDATARAFRFTALEPEVLRVHGMGPDGGRINAQNTAWYELDPDQPK